MRFAPCWVTLSDPEAPGEHLRFDRVRRWSRLVEWARWHGLDAALLFNIERSEGAPAAVREDLCQARSAAAARRMALLHALAQSVEALEGGGVRAILIKGPAAARFYPRPDLRPFADIDLLIAQADLAGALEALSPLGFAPAEPDKVAEFTERMGEVTLVRGGPLPSSVELHWRLINSPSLARGRRMDLEGAWERSRQADLEGCQVRCLSGADHLFALALHACAGHQVRRLVWVLDVAQVLRTAARAGPGSRDPKPARVRRAEGEIDWPLFLDLVRSSRAELPAWQVLWLAARLYGVAVPDEVTSAVRPRLGSRGWFGSHLLGPRRVSGRPTRVFDLCRIAFRQACKLKA